MSRGDQLELSVMELGSELYRLKHELVQMKKVQLKVALAIKSMKTVLDEKGFVTSDEFELVEELFKAQEANDKEEVAEAGRGEPEKEDFN